MSQQEGIPATQVPQGTAAAHQLIKGRNTIDLMVLILIPFGIATFLMYLRILTFQGYLGSLGVIAVMNWLIFQMIPAKESILYWLLSMRHYLKLNKVMTRTNLSDEDIDDVDIQYDPAETGGRDPAGNRKLGFLETNENSVELTQVDQVDMDKGLVWLDDGSVVAGVSVTGMEMKLANQDVKKKAIQQFHSFLNSLDFPIQIRIMSVPFDLQSSIDDLEERLDDQDVTRRPIFQQFVRVKMMQLDQEIRSMGMNNRQYQILVRANPARQTIGDSGPFNINFIGTDSPVGKFLQGRMNSGTGTKTADEKLKSLAEKRRKTVIRGLAQINQADTQAMTGEMVAKSIRNFWTRKPLEESDWKPSTPVTASDDQFHTGGQ